MEERLWGRKVPQTTTGPPSQRVLWNMWRKHHSPTHVSVSWKRGWRHSKWEQRGNSNSSTAQYRPRQCTICQSTVAWPRSNHHHQLTSNSTGRNKSGPTTGVPSHRNNKQRPTNSTPNNTKEDGQTMGANHAGAETSRTTHRTQTQLKHI